MHKKVYQKNQDSKNYKIHIFCLLSNLSISVSSYSRFFSGKKEIH